MDFPEKGNLPDYSELPCGDDPPSYSEAMGQKPKTGVKTKESIVIDTNTKTDMMKYSCVTTTDYYRKGRPYKLLTQPGVSKAKIIIRLDGIHCIDSVNLTLNHCRTNCHAKVDMIVNGNEFLVAYDKARWDNFGEQTFAVPMKFLHEGKNKIKIILNRGSPGVYWLSDLRIDIEKTIEKME